MAEIAYYTYKAVIISIYVKLTHINYPDASGAPVGRGAWGNYPLFLIGSQPCSVQCNAIKQNSLFVNYSS